MSTISPVFPSADYIPVFPSVDYIPEQRVPGRIYRCLFVYPLSRYFFLSRITKTIARPTRKLSGKYVNLYKKSQAGLLSRRPGTLRRGSTGTNHGTPGVSIKQCKFFRDSAKRKATSAVSQLPPVRENRKEGAGGRAIRCILIRRGSSFVFLEFSVPRLSSFGRVAGRGPEAVRETREYLQQRQGDSDCFTSTCVVSKTCAVRKEALRQAGNV